MRIEFDPTNRDEATAVRAILRALEQPTAGELGIVMHEAPTDDKWHNGTTYTPDATEPSEPSQDPELDANNEPHDPRIHSTPPKTNADGTWRAKRGVTADVVAAVRAERDTERAQTAPEAPNEPEREQPVKLAEETVEEHIEEVKAIAASTAPTPPAPPSGQSAAPEPVVSTPNAVAPTVGAPSPASEPSFLDVMKAITAAQKDGKIDTAKVKELCAAVGAGDSTMGLNGPDNGDKRGAFMALLGEVVS